MALDTYTALKATVADWLNRSDLTTQIPDFITLAEATMKRKIRKWTVLNSAFSVASDTVPAPADLSVPRSIRLVTGSPNLDTPLRLCTIEMLSERKARSFGVASRPTDVAFVNGTFYFAPAPDQTYTAELFYFSSLTPLSVSVATNSILSEAPDAYLYGTLLQAEPYLEHDDRTATWEPKFLKAIDELNAKREEDEFTLGLHAIRLPFVFD